MQPLHCEQDADDYSRPMSLNEKKIVLKTKTPDVVIIALAL